MARDITPEQQDLAETMVTRARAAMARIADYDQARVDRLAQAIGWALGNEATFTRLAHMSVDESGIGDRDGRVAKRFKIHGILRDALRSPSVGVIEDDPARGLVKYAKPAGVIASIGFNPARSIASRALTICGCSVGIGWSRFIGTAGKPTAFRRCRQYRSVIRRFRPAASPRSAP